MSRRIRIGSAALLIAFLAACATPVGVKPISADDADRALQENVLSTGKPSAPTIRLLLREGLYDQFQEEPDATLAALRSKLGSVLIDPDDLLFALAELSFAHGVKSGDRAQFLASTVYAYALLFPDGGMTRIRATDPRYRLAYDLYNRGLARGLETGRNAEVTLAAGVYALPFGSLTLTTPPEGFIWAGHRLERFVSASEFEVRGLRNRYQWPGIGAPLLASMAQESQESPPPDVARIPPRLRIPVSALIRIEGPRHAVQEGNVAGALELRSREDGRNVTIDGRPVAVELDPTAALAYTLEGSPIWDTELAGFFAGTFGISNPDVPQGNLFMLRPYRPGRIPIVLVHGTASSPARWAELVNEIENDRRLRDRYQIWLFRYDTGNPILYSAGLLRQALVATVHQLDPEGRDPALQRMVVIGHSQGGLLTKLTAVDSGTRFWDGISKEPFDRVKTDPETRELMQRSLFFKPLPMVKRVVFLATPHGGSYLAGFSIARWVSSLVTLPFNLATRLVDAARANPQALASIDPKRLPTSVDNMTPGNRFLKVLHGIPIAPDVKANSIIAVEGDGPLESASDGVVRYESAHIEGVESETIVHSPHSCQAAPETIEEIRRILLEHATEND